MNHPLKLENNRQNLEKCDETHKQKRENSERKTKKSTKYKHVDEKSNKKQKKNLKQGNCKENVKTSKNAVYICNTCAKSSGRSTAIQYKCKQWYQNQCFKYCF